MKKISVGVFVALVASFIVNDAQTAWASEWSEPSITMRRRVGMVVTYRAKVDSGYLVIEAKHGEGWHTYSMDNLDRARAKTGLEKPDTEQSTRFELTGLTVTGDWYQSTPKDLSTPEIKWYTWGFEDTSYFAAPVQVDDASAVTVTIFAQACNANSCSMVNGEALTLVIDDAQGNASDAPPLPAKTYQRVGDKEVHKKL